MSKKQIVVFGEDWGGLPSSTQHLIKGLLAKGYCVAWINSIGMRQPSLTKKDLQRVVQKLMAFFSAKKKPCAEAKPDELIPQLIINPLIIPFYNNPWIARINRFLLSRQLTSKFTQHSFKAEVVFTALPTSVMFKPIFKDLRWIYYCCDDFSSLSGVSHAVVEQCEQQLLQQSDKVFVSSRVLEEKFKTHHPELLEHGVDFELFTHPFAKPQDLNIKGPVIGFYGSISSWLDIELLVHCAKGAPHTAFVFIGVCHVDVGALDTLRNVYFLGPKPHQSLPAYVQHWDMAMLPFKRNDQINACSPLKLKEYLASGTPIVSTDFPEARKYQPLIHVANDKTQFLEIIKKYISAQDGLSESRRQVIAHDSWINKAEQLSAAL